MLLLVKGNSSGQFCPYSSKKKKNKKIKQNKILTLPLPRGIKTWAFESGPWFTIGDPLKDMILKQKTKKEKHILSYVATFQCSQEPRHIQGCFVKESCVRKQRREKHEAASRLRGRFLKTQLYF